MKSTMALKVMFQKFVFASLCVITFILFTQQIGNYWQNVFSLSLTEFIRQVDHKNKSILRNKTDRKYIFQFKKPNFYCACTVCIIIINLTYNLQNKILFSFSMT